MRNPTIIFNPPKVKQALAEARKSLQRDRKGTTQKALDLLKKRGDFGSSGHETGTRYLRHNPTDEEQKKSDSLSMRQIADLVSAIEALAATSRAFASISTPARVAATAVYMQRRAASAQEASFNANRYRVWEGNNTWATMAYRYDVALPPQWYQDVYKRGLAALPDSAFGLAVLSSKANIDIAAGGKRFNATAYEMKTVRTKGSLVPIIGYEILLERTIDGATALAESQDQAAKKLSRIPVSQEVGQRLAQEQIAVLRELAYNQSSLSTLQAREALAQAKAIGGASAVFELASEISRWDSIEMEKGIVSLLKKTLQAL